MYPKVTALANEFKASERDGVNPPHSTGNENA